MKATQGGYVAITFNSYLKRLRDLERAKPTRLRREVPTASQLAKICGLQQTTVNRIVKGYVKTVSIEKMSMILNAMNNLGFDTKITDFFTYTFEKGNESKETAL